MARMEMDYNLKTLDQFVLNFITSPCLFENSLKLWAELLKAWLALILD